MTCRRPLPSPRPEGRGARNRRRAQSTNQDDLQRADLGRCWVANVAAESFTHGLHHRQPDRKDLREWRAAGPVLNASRRPFPFIRKVFADSGYQGLRVAEVTSIAVGVVKKPDQVGFAVQPRRWVVDRWVIGSRPSPKEGGCLCRGVRTWSLLERHKHREGAAVKYLPDLTCLWKRPRSAWSTKPAGS